MDPKQAGEASLIALVAQSDREAVEAFDARFRPLLLRFLHGRVPPDDHADVAQETLMAAFEGIRNGHFRGQSSLGTWIVGILKKKIFDYWERQNRDRKALVSIGAPSRDGDSALDVAQPAADPNLRIEIEELLQRLPKRHRAILLLSVREGLNTDQIAAAAKLSPGTAGRILWEAKRMLRKERDLKKLSPKTDE